MARARYRSICRRAKLSLCPLFQANTIGLDAHNNGLTKNAEFEIEQQITSTAELKIEEKANVTGSNHTIADRRTIRRVA